MRRINSSVTVTLPFVITHGKLCLDEILSKNGTIQEPMRDHTGGTPESVTGFGNEVGNGPLRKTGQNRHERAYEECVRHWSVHDGRKGNEIGRTV